MTTTNEPKPRKKHAAAKSRIVVGAVAVTSAAVMVGAMANVAAQEAAPAGPVQEVIRRVVVLPDVGPDKVVVVMQANQLDPQVITVQAPGTQPASVPQRATVPNSAPQAVDPPPPPVTETQGS